MNAFAVAVLGLALTGCQAGYYTHLLGGQYDLLSRRVPITDLLADQNTAPELRQRLTGALDARAFAVRVLKLPDNDSYTLYADLDRSYAVWNVFAAPEFSLTPVEWCYGLVGCLSYRGYYEEVLAREEAARLAAQGHDVYVGGVPAYSTLGWFDDPVLNTMLHGNDDQLAGTIFHELAHQQLFAKGDTAFNESFASFVEEQGLRAYLSDFPDRSRRLQSQHEQEAQFVALMIETRSRLAALYTGGKPTSEMRPRKLEAIAQLRVQYAALREQWGGDGRYDGWMMGAINNARLLPFGLYHQWVPAFSVLFQDNGGDWSRFYQAVEALSDLEPVAREQGLKALAARSSPP